MASGNVRKIASACIQAFSIQVLGVLFFYLISGSLSKSDFGVISWSNAVVSTIAIVLGLGLEQVVLRRLASGSGRAWEAGAFLVHNLAVSAFGLAFLFALRKFWPGSPEQLRWLPLFFTVQVITFAALPFRQLLNAREQFLPYALASLCGNLLKIGLAVWITRRRAFSLDDALVLLCAGALLELALLAVYSLRKSRLSFPASFGDYRALVSEALPQYFAVLFDSLLARADWILLGLMAGTVEVANYSFAYRGFELAKLPITIAGMLLLPRLSKLLAHGALPDPLRESLGTVLQLEIAGSAALILFMNSCWSPVMDALSAHKYGASTATVFLLLSCCIPLQFCINLLWTVCFALRRYKAVARITFISSAANLLLNLVLIHSFDALGAAVAYAVATALQLALYVRYLGREGLGIPWKAPGLALLAVFVLLAAFGLALPAPGYRVAAGFIFLPLLWIGLPRLRKRPLRQALAAFTS